MIPLVLSLLGKDRTDALLEMSRIVIAHQARWRDTQMTRVAGHITGMAVLDVPEDRVDDLVAALAGIPDTQVVTSRPDEVVEVTPLVMQLNVLGGDHETLVPDLTEALAALGLVTREMRTHHHAVEDDFYFGATMMLEVLDPSVPHLSERAVEVAGSLGLSAEAEFIFDGSEIERLEGASAN